VLVCAALLWFFVLVPWTFHGLTTALNDNNVGRALYQEGLESSDLAKSTELFSQAATAFRRALAVSRRQQLPQQWAQTQNNLGQALYNQGIRSEGAIAMELLGQAVAAYRSALEVYTREQLPQQWAMTKINLKDLLEKLGDLKRAQGDLASAVSSYKEGLAIAQKLAALDPANTEWQRDLAVIESALREIEGRQSEKLSTFVPSIATARLSIPVRLADENVTLLQLADRLSEALRDAGYEGKCSYYWLDDRHGPGFRHRHAHRIHPARW
jgi:tetratricopeptide (TPR) repeat protein